MNSDSPRMTAPRGLFSSFDVAAATILSMQASENIANQAILQKSNL